MFLGSTRGGAGTPQFQNLSGTVRTTANGLIPSGTPSNANNTNNNNNSTTNLLVGTNGNSITNLSNTSSNLSTNLSTNVTNLSTNNSSSRTTLTSLYHNGVSSTVNQTEMNQTPSPSDSAVGDLETILKEKDTEINYLRETMEQNEQVIFKVSLLRLFSGLK